MTVDPPRIVIRLEAAGLVLPAMLLLQAIMNADRRPLWAAACGAVTFIVLARQIRNLTT